LETVETIHFEQLPVARESGQLSTDKLDEYEVAFRDLWKDYLKAITINERRNLKLQRQHMPKRFWKYLTEKQ
jgi:probable DNA metabolism protein